MSDIHAVPAETARQASHDANRRGQPILSIRARLIVLALLVTTPLVLERVQGLENSRARRTELAHTQVMDLARQGAEAQREFIYSMRGVLQVIGRAYAKMPADPGECNRTLLDLTGSIPWIHGLSIAGTDGRIKCATDPGAVGLSVADRDYFQNALHVRDVVLSDYLIRRTHQAPGLIAAFPAIGADGFPEGVVLASLNLPWIGDLAANAARHSGATVELFDSAGTLVAASNRASADIGRNFARQPFVGAALANSGGTVTARGLDGTPRIFAYTRVPWTRARLVIGLDESVVHSGIDREIRITYLQLAAFGALILLATWFGGEQLIVRPIRVLVRTASRFGRGDLHVRAADESWIAEFKPLAAALDDMARKLAAREEELQIANEHLDELASLDGLTGLANRRGFDRVLEREWSRAGQTRRPLALMMIDIDHFKLFNDRYGHVRGDACLRAVGETLSLVTLDEAVLVARYGGEEFAILLPGFDPEQVAALADDARRAIEDLLIVHAESSFGHVTISVGIASLLPEEGQTAADLVESADRALYAAKRRGRNRIVAQSAVLLSTAC